MLNILDTPYAKISYDPKTERLYQTWIGYASVEQFKAAIDITVAFFRTNNNVTSILSDTTEQAVLAREGSDYAASVMPDLIQFGLKKVAFILPVSSFTKLALENFIRQNKDGYTGHFPTRAEAEAWLDL